ncbi:hybrid sensor histidine kinase/response regulator [Flavipsychrobacter stenotrophus]|uniref:histidine kinase n=1 Tax=Flavipsychrobacter stenotrophus TaxID=2077091 RepID=A0A2S7SXU2_9BACT|nr:hybrid sensor histidine kinase/response regulator [Flavipsychrobacter stenotrophus]PQJ11451.1 hybrid sensor histidine kinase/response regulator [Flavipsychrobacter stenotrophus]
MNVKHKTARILIVDDDEDDFIITSDFIRSIPGNTFIIDWCPNYNEGIKKLLSGVHDLFFVDYRLGAKSGVDFLKEAKQNNCDNPIVLLTGKGNYAVDIQAMEYGAIDYLIKTELTVEKMERCIRYAVERAATLQALRANERKYRTIFEKSKDVVFVTDIHLNFIDVNSAIYNLLGFTKEEMLGTNLGDIIDQSQHKKFLLQSLPHRHSVNDWEVLLNTKDGEKKQCTLSVTMEQNETESGYVQGIIHDITNLKKIEKANLQGEKLAAAGRLVRTIAHEVRNPLNNITLSIEQMQHYIKDESMELYMSIIQRNSKRISDLISELLYTSRPAENTLQREVLQNVLDDVISASIDRITLKNMKLHVNYPDEMQEIMADREKLKLALLNIVINAIEAMAEGEGMLVINIDHNDKYAILTITDNGAGISEENISRLFEPYFTQKRNGVGLGLTFTLNILQAHKAIIEVTSELGKGTVFTISFPLAG